MIRFLLDANALIELLRTKESAVTHQVFRHRSQEIGIPTLALYELYVGAYRSARVEENLSKISRIGFAALPLSPDDVREAARIRMTLESTGNMIGPNDVLIAGQAKARGLVLVTHNVREFSRVSGLTVED